MSEELIVWPMSFGVEVEVLLGGITVEPAEKATRDYPGCDGCIYYETVSRRIDGKWTDVTVEITDREHETLQELLEYDYEKQQREGYEDE
jgi:hypothetical protein